MNQERKKKQEGEEVAREFRELMVKSEMEKSGLNAVSLPVLFERECPATLGEALDYVQETLDLIQKHGGTVVGVMPITVLRESGMDAVDHHIFIVQKDK